VLISDQVGLKDFVLQHKLGWVLECEAAIWRKALIQIWENPSVSTIIREKAPQTIQQHFNIDKLTDAYKAMYQHVRHINQTK
jgi:glycosyltransferase involved in cell wall biosynthesis